MSYPFLSVIVPTHNNAKDILLTVFDIHRHLENQNYDSEIIVIDDGSGDATGEMIKRYAPLINNLKFIENKTRQGKNFVIKQAMLLAKGDWRLLLSPQNTISVIEFNKLIPYAKKGYNIFADPDGYWRCFSAQSAEAIFPYARKCSNWEITRLANIFGYRIKGFAFKKSLWHNFLNKFY